MTRKLLSNEDTRAVHDTDLLSEIIVAEVSQLMRERDLPPSYLAPLVAAASRVVARGVGRWVEGSGDAFMPNCKAWIQHACREYLIEHPAPQRLLRSDFANDLLLAKSQLLADRPRALASLQALESVLYADEDRARACALAGLEDDQLVLLLAIVANQKSLVKRVKDILRQGLQGVAVDDRPYSLRNIALAALVLPNLPDAEWQLQWEFDESDFYEVFVMSGWNIVAQYGGD